MRDKNKTTAYANAPFKVLRNILDYTFIGVNIQIVKS